VPYQIERKHFIEAFAIRYPFYIVLIHPDIVNGAGLIKHLAALHDQYHFLPSQMFRYEK
jgi:hypothetical protein